MTFDEWWNIDIRGPVPTSTSKKAMRMAWDVSRKQALEDAALEAEKTGQWGSYGDLAANIRALKAKPEASET